jgi:glutamate decarboxylase
VKTEGNAVVPGLVAFTSEHAHYSYAKACNLLGLGTKSLVKVKCDPVTGDMDPQALKAALHAAVERGQHPFFVGTTAGSTVLGSFDPFSEIMDVVDEFNRGRKEGTGRVWMHVDGAWGGACLFSNDPAQRLRMRGAERSDSFTWNPHKLLGAPLQCSCFLTRHEGELIKVSGSPGRVESRSLSTRVASVCTVERGAGVVSLPARQGEHRV